MDVFLPWITERIGRGAGWGQEIPFLERFKTPYAKMEGESLRPLMSKNYRKFSIKGTTSYKGAPLLVRAKPVGIWRYL